MDEMLTKRVVAKMLGVSLRSVERLRRLGRLRAVKVGPHRNSCVRFPAGEVKRFIEAHTDPTVATAG